MQNEVLFCEENNAITSSSDLHMVVELSNDIWFNDKIHVIRNPFC